MKLKLRFTKYGLINLLISLIPIIPFFALIPYVLIGEGTNNITGSCLNSTWILLCGSLTLAVLVTSIYVARFDRVLLKSNKKVIVNFECWSFIIYSFVNIAMFIIYAGVDGYCHGDGQLILYLLYSGPVASLSLIIFGFIIDIKVNYFRREFPIDDGMEQF